jgi:hypothetical protein
VCVVFVDSFGCSFRVFPSAAQSNIVGKLDKWSKNAKVCARIWIDICERRMRRRSPKINERDCLKAEAKYETISVLFSIFCFTPVVSYVSF